MSVQKFNFPSHAISQEAVCQHLNRIGWEERWLDLEAHGRLDLPAYAGATLRGALGAVIRPRLCDEGGRCGERCLAPEKCRFFSLFEQGRAQNGSGSNIPKPLILEPPLAGELRAIARGGVVRPPYELLSAKPLPDLVNSWRIGVEPGGRIRLGLKALGAARAALDGVVEAVGAAGLDVKGGSLRLQAVRAVSGNLSAPGALAPLRRLRVALVTPAVIRAENGASFEPRAFAQLLLDQTVVRTLKILNAFFMRPAERIPFVRPSWPAIVMTGHRLFRYRLRRHSFRQGRWMDFDGVVGWIEWEGEVASVLPWMRAAEILHVGQKATFGLGKLEVIDPASPNATQ